MYAIGDKVSFTPTSFAADNRGSIKDQNARETVHGVVTSIHRKHRWYRVEWKQEFDCAQHECFKY